LLFPGFSLSIVSVFSSSRRFLFFLFFALGTHSVRHRFIRLLFFAKDTYTPREIAALPASGDTEKSEKTVPPQRTRRQAYYRRLKEGDNMTRTACQTVQNPKPHHTGSPPL